MISASQDPVWGESGSGGFAADGTTSELPKNPVGAVLGVGASSTKGTSPIPQPWAVPASSELPEPGQSHQL